MKVSFTCMRFVVLIATCFSLSLQAALAADGAVGSAPLPAAKGPVKVLTKPERLDALFNDLKKAKSPAVAEGVAARISREWADSGSASVNVMMNWANEAMEAKKYPIAMDFLDQVVVLQPDYAEGWNRRATLHFMMDNYAKSMADIEKTLKLEPRHYGALSGMGQIFMVLDKKELALRSYERALEVYPMMRNLQEQVGQLADELAGNRI
jgi:tetratricopeptide (TPR) repeat protein